VTDPNGPASPPSASSAPSSGSAGRGRSKAPLIDAALLGSSPLALYLSLILLVGFGLLLAGLQVVGASPVWGFSYTGAMAGIASQLAVTGPAAILIAAATAANVVIGALVLRLAGQPAFKRVSDMILGGFAAAVVLDSAALFLLGWAGLFGWPELILLHVAVAVAWLAVRSRRPLFDGPVRLRPSRPLAWWPLVLAVWAGPLIIQFASPTVPFMDVLPNHVAPVEHVRIFGSFATLTTSPSPIYGPSRIMLGYVGLLSQLTTITKLDAILAEAAFALPLTVLIALSMRRLAGALFGGTSSFWILLTFPLTFTFMRIPDARGTVVVFPAAAWAVARVAEELRRGVTRPGVGAGRSRIESAGDAAPAQEVASSDGAGSEGRPDLGLALALGAAILLHPVIGLVAFGTAAGALVLYPATMTRRLLPALVGGAIISGPQVLTMVGIGAPSWVGALFIAAAIAAAWSVAPVLPRLSDRFMRPIEMEFPWRAVLLVAGIGAVLAIAQSRISSNPSTPSELLPPAMELQADFPRLLMLCMLGAILAILRPSRGWILLGCGLAAGFTLWMAASFVGYSGLTEQAVHYEVPKSVEYWIPVMLALGAAGGIAALISLRRLGLLRPAAVAGFLVITIYPITGPIQIGPLVVDGSPVVAPLVSNDKIGEHRGAESVGLALLIAEQGYWVGQYPDPRLIIDQPRQEVVDEIRAEEAAGRIGPGTKVLNIASSFQQWVSVPIGVFTGAMETSISLQPEVSIHTEGGRLLGFNALDGELASGYGYVVLEPAGLTPDLVASTQASIAAAGFTQIWSNSQATIYRHS
jgi:hypothetical protein